MKSIRHSSLQHDASFSLLPTPLTKLYALSKELGHTIFIKRDDLTGFAGGGNKTRKIDYLMMDAQVRGVDTIIAIGGVQSNFCRIVAAAGAVKNIDVHLVLGGIPSAVPNGNLFLDGLFGATIHHVHSGDWREWENHAALIEEKLTAQGKKVDALPIGGSTAIGALGYVQAMNEIMEDAIRMGVRFDIIVHATSSGGTQAGLLVGKAITGWDGLIMGVAVAKHSNILQDEILDLATKTGKVFGVGIERPDILVDDAHVGEGYAKRTQQAEEAIELFARKEGILLDHVYTGKAAAALIEYCRKGKFTQEQNILFVHTGGSFELFA